MSDDTRSLKERVAVYVGKVVFADPAGEVYGRWVSYEDYERLLRTAYPKDLQISLVQLHKAMGEPAVLGRTGDGSFEACLIEEAISRLRAADEPKASTDGPTGDYRDQLYALLVRRGWSQHEAHATAYDNGMPVRSQPPIVKCAECEVELRDGSVAFCNSCAANSPRACPECGCTTFECDQCANRISQPPSGNLPDTLPIPVKVGPTIFDDGSKTSLMLDCLRRWESMRAYPAPETKSENQNSSAIDAERNSSKASEEARPSASNMSGNPCSCRDVSGDDPNCPIHRQPDETSGTRYVVCKACSYHNDPGLVQYSRCNNCGEPL